MLLRSCKRRDLESEKIRPILSKMLNECSLTLNHLDFGLLMFFQKNKSRIHNEKILLNRGLIQSHLDSKGMEREVVVVRSGNGRNGKRDRQHSPRLIPIRK